MSGKTRLKKVLMKFPTRTAVLFMTILAVCSSFAQTSGVCNEASLININPDRSGEQWIAGGISFDEWNSSLPPELSSTLLKKSASSTVLPTKCDNSTNQAFRPVFNQKGGSCAQASGIAYQYTYEMNVLRNLPSNVPKNQYPYDHTYNFLNAGSGSKGSVSQDGWNIIKALGIPDVETYGGFGQGLYTKWLSGYDAYYKGMSNRIESSFSIRIRVADDIKKMKQFLFDHSNGSTTGGLLNFAADVTEEKLANLATGTPEAGKKAVISFGQTGGHAMTIAGYNDSIRYDYNGDGKYTNTIDINSDGVVDVRDWEIGAAFMVNSWGIQWGNQGKAYLMYKVLADDKAKGGIWSNTVTGITIGNTVVIPKLTSKVKMTFNPRSSVRIRAGYATNPSATAPISTSLKTFGKAFNMTGGAFSMQGVNNDPIEIGLDISDFVPKLTTAEYALFLQVEANSGSGTVQEFSVIDYSSGKAVETVCQEKNVAITTGTKMLKVVKSTAPLMVISPNGGEKWELGRKFDISWSTKETDPVAIELLKNGTVASTIASSASVAGKFSWEIPTSIQAGTGYTIRIRNTAKTTISDVSDAPFSIENKSELDLVSSDSSGYLVKGSTATISWKSNLSGSIKIDLYRHGIFEMKIDSVQVSSNSCNWKIPTTVQVGFDYRFRITSKDKEWLYDESAADFAIGYPIVTPPYNQAFDNFKAGDTLCSSWEQFDDDDINWTVIKGATPSKTNTQAGGTGPSKDHTSGSGMYIYVEASTPNNPGKDAILLSPVFDISTFKHPQVTFWAHMFSREKRMGEFWVDVYANGKWNDSVVYLTGDHGDQWFEQVIDLTRFTDNKVQVRFRVTTGTDYDSDICIDDFAITEGITPSLVVNNATRRPQVAFTLNQIVLNNYSGNSKVFTIDGRLVLQKTIQHSQEAIDISQLAKGVYLLKIDSKVLSFMYR
jgi:hypothetical protein